MWDFFYWSNLGSHCFLHWYMKHDGYTYGEITFTAYVYVFVDHSKGKNNFNLLYNTPKLFNPFGIIRNLLKPFASNSLGLFQLHQGHYLLFFVALTAQNPESCAPSHQSNIIINFLTIFAPPPMMAVELNQIYLKIPKAYSDIFFVCKSIVNTFTTVI